MDNNYVTIKLSSILRGSIKAHKEGNDTLSNELKNIYFKATSDSMVFPKNLPLVKYLENLDIEQEHVNIDQNVLLNSWGIAKAKYNYEMEKRIASYYRAYMDTIREGISDIDIMVKILSDEEVVSFIDQNNNLNEYVKELHKGRKKNAKVKEKVIGLPEVA